MTTDRKALVVLLIVGWACVAIWGLKEILA